MSKDNQDSFNKLMFANINTSCYYPIRRSFGQTLQSCDIDAVIAYTKLSNNKNRIEQNIEFLLAGLCYNVTKQGQQRSTYIRFEDVLKRLNRENEIENFLKLRYDNTGYFAKRFYTLAKKVIPLLESTEQFDYIQLYKDLKYWNYNNSVKMRWAMAIVNFDNNENKEINKEIEKDGI